MKRFAITILALALARSLCAADEPEVIVQLAHDRIYEGESVLYRVTLNHVEDPSPPKLEGFDDFEIQSRGEQSLDSHHVTIINGRRTEVTRRGRAYDFLLTPRRAGELTVPAPIAVVNGVTLRGEALKLRVIAPQDQDLAILEARCDRTVVYPTQTVTVTLTIAVKGLSEPFADEDPVAVLPRSPSLSIPWADDNSLPPGVQPSEPLERWIGKYLDRRGAGFNINRFRVPSASPFSIFDDAPSGFLPPSKRVQRPDTSGKMTEYREYTLERSLVPMQIGECAFGRASLKGAFAARVTSTGRADLEDVYVITETVAVTVRDAPLEGRPDSYCGAIGHFDWSGRLAPTEAKTGDPMTLTLILRGRGTLDAVQSPQLADMPEIAGAYKVYEVTEESGKGERRFIYGLRPLRAGSDAFPAVPISYFDVDKEQYVTLATDEIPVRIAKAEHIPVGDIAVSDRTSASRNAEIEIQEGGIFANDSALNSLQDDSVDPIRWFAGLGSLAGFYLIIVLVNQKVRRVTGDPDLVRRRAAATRARRRFRDADAEDRSPADRADLQQAAIFGLVADAAGIPEAGLTSDDARVKLEHLGIDEQLSNRLSRWCEACDAARYGASTDAALELHREAETLLEHMIGSLKSKKLVR
jgi:hypothetical protein